MASSNKTLTVLTPNGRRQNVKVTPNSTLLQVLEEVCKKQGFKPEDYDLKHHNNVLDVSSIIRFSGLPNNAQLEMCPIQKTRSENPVTLGLQLESGTRLTGSYFPNENLWNILTHLCPNEVKVEENPVVIYMRTEVYGLDALKTTTLKNLGLTGGRAMLRLIHRKPEELRTQANVSAPLPSKPVEEKPYVRKLQKIEPEINDKVPEPESVNIQEPKTENVARRDTNNLSPTYAKENKHFFNDFIKKEKAKKSVDPQKNKTTKNVETVTQEKDESNMDQIVFLGERNALAFSLDMAQTVTAELPDEFFDLTVKDAKKLLRDLKQKRIEMEETPLQTSAHRNLEQNKKTLRHLNQYKRSIIRIQFPDRTVLQGTFKPLETIENVKEFVKEFLEDSKSDFHLFTTPPKTVLQSETTLLDADCVPSALVHFGIDIPVKGDYRFLKPALYNQFTSHSTASLAAVKSRGKERTPVETEEVDDNTSDLAEFNSTSTPMDVDMNVGASTSSGADAGTSYTTPARMVSTTPKEKLPKWFKPSK